MLSAGYTRSGQINFLRPATQIELDRRPRGNILSTCRTVYQEAVPVLYRGRNFLFLTGPCPRGRYQAYATQIFLTRLTPLARSHITSLSIIAQNYEEDCCVKDTGGAYVNLAAYIERSLPSFKTLCFNLWDERLKDMACLLCRVFVKEGASICLTSDPASSHVVDCKDPHSYGVALRGIVTREHEDAFDVRKETHEEGERKNATDEKDRRDTEQLEGERVWKEVDTEEEGWEHEAELTVPMHRQPEERKRHRSRRLSKMQRVMSKSQGKNKGKAKEEVQEVEDDDEWVDATLSPRSVGGSKDGDAESWELV
jgi:hypothetical protein